MKTFVAIHLLFISFIATSQSIDTTKEEKLSFHAQNTVITQHKPAFKAKYSGANSLITQKGKSKYHYSYIIRRSQIVERRNSIYKS